MPDRSAGKKGGAPQLFGAAAYFAAEIISAAAVIAAYTVFCVLSARAGKTTGTFLAGGAAALLLYLVISLVLFFISRLFNAPTWLSGADIAQSGNFTLDIMTSLRFPVLITDEENKIVWYNSAFAKLFGTGRRLYGQPLNLFCSASPAELLASKADEGLSLNAFGSVWGVKGYSLENQSKNYLLTMWTDRGEIERTARKLEDENVLVAYIVIDNIEEVMQYVQDKSRVAVASIDGLLKDWAASVDGIIREYERDRYIFFFSAKHLKEFTEKKFDIIDRIREIRIGESKMSLTVSIGVSGIAGSLSEKEVSAGAALDMALQRGGDQVVVRGGNDYEFYGGRSRGTPKRTTVKSRVIAKALAGYIADSSNVLIMGHRNADFDSIGACIGLARFAMFCGVRVNIVINPYDPNLRDCLERMKKLPEYDTVFISAAEAQEKITSETLMIIADVNNKNQYEAPSVVESVFTTVIIDHHRKSTDSGTKPSLTYIEPSASSTCELVVEILEMGVPAGQLKPEEANIMFAGMLLDTKQFSRNTGTRTFSAALYLRNEGANPASAQKLFNTDILQLRREAEFVSSAELFRGSFAIAVCREECTDSDRIAAAKAADKLLTVGGVRASFTVCRIGETVHVSGRSQGDVNVQIILERLGGGGHFDAAATQLRSTDVDGAVLQLTDAIDQYLAEINKK